MEPFDCGVAFLYVSKYGRKQFLNREPLEPPVSKYGTVETGVENSF